MSSTRLELTDQVKMTHQRTKRKSLCAFSLDELPKHFSESVTQSLGRQMITPAHAEKTSLLMEDALDQSQANLARRTSPLFDSNSPCPPTLGTLPASLTKMTNLCSTASGYSDWHVFHANRVTTFCGIAKKLLSFELSWS